MGLLTAMSGSMVVPGGELGLLVWSGLFGASLLDRLRDGGDGGDAEDDPLLDDGGALGGDDGDGGDGLDGLGGMGDWDDDDPFGGDDDDDTAELENRLEDLENEVASISSTVTTVRSENEEISGQVEDISEDIRSLLDIYEMVTRGINPFVDDVQAGGMGGDLGGDASFGLFDDDDDDEKSEDEDLDDDLASAEAESFFDEDLADDGFDDLDEFEGDEFEDDDLGDLDDLDDLDDPDEDDEDDEDDEFGEFGEFDDDTTDTETMATENGGGKSFSELKDEYESGDADWADDGADDDPFDADGAAGVGGFDDGDDAVPTAESDPEPAPDAAPADAADDGGFEFVSEGDLSAKPQKPYLTQLPGDYVGDLMVMEWLEYLVEEADATDAVRAVNYYERIEWVDEDVARRLEDFLSGFGDIDRNRVDEPGTAKLTLDHHTQSLKYVMQLTNATAESVVIDRWPQLSGGFRGSQR